MSVVVVTVTQAVTAAPTSSGRTSSLSPTTTAGIIIGTLLGGVIFIALVLYLLKRYSRYRFTRVADHPYDDAGGAYLRYMQSTTPRRSRLHSHHLQKPSISSEPLISPASLPPLPPTSDGPSSGIPRFDAISPVTGGSQHSSVDLGEVKRVTASGTVSRATVLVPQPSAAPPQLDLGNTSPHTRQMSGDDVPSPSTPTKLQQPLFLHRMLKSRAQASAGVALAHRPSLDLSPSHFNSDVEKQLLAGAEHSPLRDAEAAMSEGEEDWEEVETTESIYSQVSAPLDHSMFFPDPASRRNSGLSLPRRKSSRKKRVPAPSTGLPPVAELPGIPRVFKGQTVSPPVSIVACSSLDAQVSHRTASPPMSLEQSGTTFPLLTSVNFGKSSTKSHTPGGSISSIAALGSSSSGGTSRYPSLTTSSIGLSSRPGPRSDADTDWHYPPAGLAGLTSLEIGPLENPHSPVEERPRRPDSSSPDKRARLREGTTSSTPEVERRDVMQGGIARIDVAL